MDGTSITPPDLPPWFGLVPSRKQVIDNLLVPKIKDATFRTHGISEIDVNKFDPQEIYGPRKEGKEWFFNKLRKKYKTGVRANRKTKSGFWKPTGNDDLIYLEDKLIGKRKNFVFKPKEASNGRTKWVMKEYRIEGNAYPELTAKEPWVVVSIKSEEMKGKGKMKAISPVASMEATENAGHYGNMEGHPSPNGDVVPETLNEDLQVVPNYSTESLFQSEQHLTVQDLPNFVLYPSPIQTPASNASDYDMQLVPSVTCDTARIVQGGLIMDSDEHHISSDNPSLCSGVTYPWIPNENLRIISATPIYSPTYSRDYGDILASGDGQSDSNLMQEIFGDLPLLGFCESSSVGMARRIEQSRQDIEGNMEDQRLHAQVDRRPNDPEGTATPWVDGDWEQSGEGCFWNQAGFK